MSKQHSGKDYVKAAQKADLRVDNGRGDHVKIYTDDGRMMVVPMHRELATGTECVIRKWFLRLGIVVAVLAGIMAVLQ